MDAIINSELNAQICTEAEGTLLSGLIEEYGNPTTHTVASEGSMETFDWLFPSTKITLLWFHSRFKELDSVQLFYTPRKKSSDL